MFGTRYVGAIHGLLLTAWSMAGIFRACAGELYPRVQHHPRRASKAQAYNVTVYIMAGLFVIGFIANLLVKAVDKRYHMVPDGETATRPQCRSLAFSSALGFRNEVSFGRYLFLELRSFLRAFGRVSRPRYMNARRRLAEALALVHNEIFGPDWLSGEIALEDLAYRTCRIARLG